MTQLPAGWEQVDYLFPRDAMGFEKAKCRGVPHVVCNHDGVWCLWLGLKKYPVPTFPEGTPLTTIIKALLTLADAYDENAL